MISVIRCIRSLSFLFTLLVGALLARPAVAQDITGALQGTVVSPEGKPAPEVRISVSGPYLQGPRETLTNRDGFFQFLALPPGKYALHVTRIGLRPLDVRDIVVELGRTTAVGALRLEVQPIELKPVEVQAHTLSIDPVHTTAGGTLRASDYAALPVDRDYKSLMVVLPQANDSHRGDPINVAGSTGLENMYYIDGVNVTDARTAERATSLPYEFVRAVDVKLGGYEAQYGRALGAIVNAVTYSGTNDHEGRVFGFVQPGRWAATPRLAPVVAQSEPMSYDYGARVSGPVLRDRLWYSAAVNPRVDRIEKEVPGIGFYPDKTSAVRFAGKLTWRVTPKTNLELSTFGDPTEWNGVIPVVSGIRTALNPDPLLHRIESGGTTTSLRATVTPTPSLLLQASVAHQHDRWTREAATARGRAEELYADFTTGTVEGGYAGLFHDDRDRTSLTLRGTLTLPGHTVATGLDYEDTKVESEQRTGFYNRLSDSLYFHDFLAYKGTFHNRSPAVYLQDAWRLTDRLMLSAGVRWSAQYVTGASGRTAQRITDEWQPRVGFSWQPGRVGTQRLFGSYGRYYQTLPLSIAVLMLVDWTEVWSFYSSDPRVPGTLPTEVQDFSTRESQFANQIPGLHAENFDEFTLGYERLLGAGAKLTVRGMRRDLRSSFQIGNNYEGYVLGTPGKGDFSFLPPPKRQYTALEVASEGSVQRLRYRASYVLSRSWGNYPGLFDSDAGSASPGMVSRFMLPHQAVNSTGFLPNDHTHVVKLSGSCDIRSRFAVGGMLTFESGAPINEFMADRGFGWGSPSFVVQRGTAGRTPAVWNLDLRLAYELPPARGAQTRVHMDLLHVGNPRRATRVDELHYAWFDDEGNPMPNPYYKQPLAYQPPMAARLGVQVGF